MLFNVSKSSGIWVCIKVRILIETSWKLGFHSPFLYHHWLFSVSCHAAFLFCCPCSSAGLPSKFTILCLWLLVSIPFPFQWNYGMLKRVYLVSRHSGRLESLWNSSKNSSLTEPFTIILIWGVLISTVATRNKLYWGRSRWDTYSLTQHSQKYNWFPQESLILQHWRLMFKESSNLCQLHID